MPRPTTPSPITAPPEKATSSAFPKLSLAALAVLTLAFVATFIPRNPANAEHKAPTAKDKAQCMALFVVRAAPVKQGSNGCYKYYKDTVLSSEKSHGTFLNAPCNFTIRSDPSGIEFID